jgi:Large polyvalent protein-associated domain 1
MARVSAKIEDTVIPSVSAGGRLDKHWRKEGIRNFSKAGKTRLMVTDDPFTLSKKFGLKGIEFGRWVTNEDRVNFLDVMNRSLVSLAAALKLSNHHIGLSLTTGLAFGARGSGPALAHYEPGTGMINLTRYHRDDVTEITKPTKFFESGGMASFAHEWGHAIDYFLGTYIDQHSASRALSFGDIVFTSVKDWSLYERISFQKGSHRWLMREILSVILFSKRGSTFSAFYSRLLLALKKDDQFGEYYLRANELFARVFEQYVHFKLQGIGIRKGFLVKKKYHKPGTFNIYVTPEQLKRIVPLIDKLISGMKSDLNKIKAK